MRVLDRFPILAGGMFFLGLLTATTAQAALSPGARAPDFQLRATLGGKEFDASLRAMLSKGPIVLYFYPAAFTKGCTVEAHDFAEAVPAFEKLGAQVIGVSEDKIDTLDRFSVSACQSKFPVAADSTGTVAHAYDATLPVVHGYASRTSYAIAPNGAIIASYNALDPDEHVSRMLSALKDWSAKTGHPSPG